MNIGYLDKSYPNKRCIIDQTPHKYIQLNPNVIYKVHVFKNRVIRFILTRIGMKYKEWDKTSSIYEQWYSNVNEVDLLHVFNYVPITSKNWVCTFESNVPVTDSTVSRPWEQGDRKKINDRLTLDLLERCSQDNCKGLIALSESAYNIQISTIRNSILNESIKKKIERKVVIIHPPQELIITENDLNKKLERKRDYIHFILIGHDFYRKGGFQIVKALEKFHTLNYKIHLTIVSKLVYGDYASESSYFDFEELKQKISSYSWIEQYDQLANIEVLKLAMNADVGLLPSLAETYGYSALELMACGCPVITTNIRAFKEINDTTRGWVCNITPNQYGERVYANMKKEEKIEVMSDLQKELERILKDILDKPQQIAEKAMAGYNYVKSNHSKEKFAELLTAIYE